MARRFHQSDGEGRERTSDPAPPQGYIQLKPARNRAGNKNWRTPDPSNLAIHDSPVDTSSSPTDFNFTTSPMNAALPGNGSDHVSPTDTQFNPGVMKAYTRVFGKLPDLIHLGSQTGDFDGQVIFIGHPNRDVSSHQWSSDIFQWVDLGTWSHVHARIEGALAADIVESEYSRHSVEYFKQASQAREKQILKFGRPGNFKETVEDPPAPTNTKTVLQSTSSSSPLTARTDSCLNSRSSIHSAPRNITGKRLDDPFVTPAKPQQPAIPMTLNSRAGKLGGVGSMNFNYQFPGPNGTVTFDRQQTHRDPQHTYSRERLASIPGEELPLERETPAGLREIGFGEEAASSFSTPVVRLNKSRPLGPLSPEDARSRLQLKNKLSELGTQPRRLSAPTGRGISIPDVSLNPDIRAMFPQGYTVANPRRGVNSTLNAAAAPYTRMPTAFRPLEDTDSEFTANNAPPVPEVNYRDPDGAQGRVYEFAEGVDSTPQNFNGPFFTGPMPNTQNLITSLPVPVNEGEKLFNWFHDGQRPARQQDYAKSLMAAAWAEHKTHNFGAIGEASSRVQDETKYDNTRIFARVYENLLQYSEEARAGTRSDYFTEAWKIAPLHQRDLTIEGNNSFFNDTATHSRFERAPVRPTDSSPDVAWGNGSRKPPMPVSRDVFGQSTKSKWGTGRW
ncbi:hypothetical protein P280DRAFT_241440 [Massarina eburnea CBS 473.64]|uniref:Uncharacterized protein n=1 Tax=Massarina eburnea CBS 473.64 TaxID=1395130 RepID=A0A6A6S5H4_9PLEO|nr:hypothetical protein P280DRAFT_241440 [Massarina eburnea CBS 473.64]